MVPFLVFIIVSSMTSCSDASKRSFEKYGTDRTIELKNNCHYRPTWESLDSRPLPSWYDQGKIGIFINMGIFSVPSFSSEWFWHDWQTSRKPAIVDFMASNYAPSFMYQDFAPQFTAQFFNATQWTQLFKKAGARYVVLNSKHHEGYTLWPSKYSFGWNSMDVGPHRDLVGELADSIRADSSLRFGLYHSLFEWYNPLWIKDQAANFTTNEFVRFKTLPELYELVNQYKPEVVWSDGQWDAPGDYWQSKEFLTWLYNESPVKDTVVTNDRWGSETGCKHGGFFSCSDRYNPGVLQSHKWENCFTLDKLSWGFRRNAQLMDHLSPKELVKTVVETVACGGNALVNVGPTKEGIIPPIQQERLLQLGQWLSVNGDAIYDTVPWTFQNDTSTPGVWFTCRPAENAVFAIILEWPENSILRLEVVNGQQLLEVRLLGSSRGPIRLPWRFNIRGITVELPVYSIGNNFQLAWTLKLLTYQF